MTDLCALDDVRTELEMGVTETGRNAKITALLPVATRVITRWCRREFINAFPAADATPRKFAYYGGSRLSLFPYDLQSASVVQMDTDTSAVTLAVTTDYYLEPLPALDGVYTHLLFTSLEPASVGGRDTRREVSITGVWGFATIPEDVKRAAVLSICGWLDKPVNEYGNNADGEARQATPAVGAGYQLSLGVKSILSDYRRRGVA